MKNRRDFELIRCSPPEIDGMVLELWSPSRNALLMEAIYSDTDGTMTFTRYDEALSAEDEAWFRQRALELLTPGRATRKNLFP